ncbi:MAG: bifunctional heptose 7-phosphate kinase/heptose 1-phosphate adenyltransferase [Gemmatimonadales bacterium]|jgi:D-beta-D-heptose 7-phosphate kinase/D-beta-D-heptose 1-phosphate adenosyltransferase
MIETIQRHRLVALLDSAKRYNVAVAGDAMLDVYLIGDVERISPEAPVPVVRVRDRRHALGGAANVAQNVLALGASCSMVCTVGDDVAGMDLTRMLDQAGASVDGVLPSRKPTTTKTRIVARAQQLVRVDEEDDADSNGVDTDALIDAIRTTVRTADALVLEDYNKGVLAPRVIRAAMEEANARGIPVIVDPKFRNFFEYRGATIFKPNRRELESALGATLDIASPAALPATCARLGVEHLLLTLGEHGMVLVSSDGEVGRIPTTAREVYDVVGAGDTVTAYLATMLAAGATASEAAVIANFAAGVEVGKLGAATVSTEEVLEAYDAYRAENS